MATETASGLSDHARGVTVTTAACLAGIVGALVSATLFGVDAATAKSTMPVVVLVACMFAEYPILKVLGVPVEEFGVKDNLYVGFMTFSLWFITYGILLSAGISA